MTPEEHRDAAADYFHRQQTDMATYHATMGVLETLLQFDICGHGTRGFCKDCLLNDLRNNQPWTVEVRER